MAPDIAMFDNLGGMVMGLLTGLFYLVIGGALVALVWWYKTQVAGFPYKVILEERRGRDLLTTITGGRFEEINDKDGGKQLVFKIKGFPHELQQINYSHVQADNSIRIYRAGQNEFRPAEIKVDENTVGWKPLVDPSWERSWADAVERVVRMRSEHNWLKEYAWVIPLGVCIVLMLVVALAVLDGMSKVTEALTATANAFKSAAAAQASPEVQKASSDKPPVIFALAGVGDGG